MPKRKKYPRLPSGFGSIRYLGKGRSAPYAVHPPATDRNELGRYIRPAALCYMPDWYSAFAVLSAYHAGTYDPGKTSDYIRQDPTADIDDFCRKLLRDHAIINRQTAPETGCSFDEVYQAWFISKYGEKASKRLSEASKRSTEAAYKRFEPFHRREFASIRLQELQDHINDQDASRSTVNNMLILLKGMYKYAIPRELCEKDLSPYLVAPSAKEVEHAEPFTDEELAALWKRKDDPVVEMVLIMCYSGFRVSAYTSMEVNLKEKCFRGGVKTAAGKDRIVPIHSAIYPLVLNRITRQEKLLAEGAQTFRLKMYAATGRSPHSTRHTFSRLCESFKVSEADRKRMLGHSFGADVTNGVYGHRTVEELREEIEKIKVPV